MNCNKLFSAAIFVLLAMSSCTSEDEFVSTKSEYVNAVRVTVEDFVPESSTTRTAYTVDNTGFHFQWADGDALGIYPVGGDQVKFPISSGDGSASASFDGGAWKLRSEYQYAAYYPFSVENYKIAETSLPVSFTGQTQSGNGSTAHLGAYDYLACAATAPDGNGGVDLSMKHLGAFVRLQLTMPKADTYSSVVLESDGTKFVTSGTFDLTAATPVITPTSTSSTYTINLTEVSTTEKNQVITVYAIVAPANLSSSNIKVTVHGAGQTTYVQSVAGKNFAARSAYNISVTEFPSGTNASGEDVSWDEDPYNGHDYVEIGGIKWATMNVGATTVSGSPSTCYGDYFAWGETEPRYTDISFGVDEHGSTIGYMGGFKSNHSDGYYSTDYPSYTGTILDVIHDAAAQAWGGNWRTPTVDDFISLYNACTTESTPKKAIVLSTSSPSGGVYWLYRGQTYLPEYTGVSGALFVDKNDTSKRVFFPASGYTSMNERDKIVTCGEQVSAWTSSLYTDSQTRAFSICANKYSVCATYNFLYVGLPVRPVCQ